MRHHRKVIRIVGEDSPNVRLATAESGAYWDPDRGEVIFPNGVRPSGTQIVPGVLTWDEYVTRRTTWDAVRQCIGIDAQFWQGRDALLYPPDWLNRAEAYARQLAQAGIERIARGMGVDPAEGGDKSCWSVVDEYGLIKLVVLKTPDTTFVTARTLALMQEYNLTPDRVVFDRGGGGKEHADRLNAQGYPVRTVAFGEPVVPDPKRGLVLLEEKREHRAERYAYKNRRAQLFAELRQLLDPGAEGKGDPLSDPWQAIFRLNPGRAGESSSGGLAWGLPAEYTELRRQLAPIPLLYDPEGRLYMLPKNRLNENEKQAGRKTLIDLIGHSPDEADSLVLAIHAMCHKSTRMTAGAI